MEELKCKFNPMGTICDGQTLCSFCGWNPAEAERRRGELRRKANGPGPLRLTVKRRVVVEDWKGYHDPR